jgi:hypothetical protein
VHFHGRNIEFPTRRQISLASIGVSNTIAHSKQTNVKITISLKIYIPNPGSQQISFVILPGYTIANLPDFSDMEALFSKKTPKN